MGVSGPDPSKIPLTSMTDISPMIDDSTLVVTAHAALQSDLTVQGQIGKLQTSSGVVFGAFPYPFTATTNSSGVAIVYLTSDGTATGTAAYSTVFMPSITPVPIGTNNYQPTAITLSGDKKTLSITINQIAPALGILVLSGTAPSGIVVQGTAWGK